MADESTRGAREHRLTSGEMAAWRPNILAWTLIERRLEHQLQRDWGIPHAYYAILVGLKSRPDRSLSLTKLADDLGFSQSRMSHAVDRLESAGWVERRRDPADKRVRTITLTASGALTFARASEGHIREVRASFFAHLDSDDLQHLSRIGAKLLSGLAKDMADGVHPLQRAADQDEPATPPG